MGCQFVVYACPKGDLGNMVESYFSVSSLKCGKNAANQYMPHCSLTGFFEDELETVSMYTKALETVLEKAMDSRPVNPIKVLGMKFKPDFHYLDLESNWIRKLMVNFAAIANSPTRTSLSSFPSGTENPSNALPLKEWLYLSLAYKFSPEHHQILAATAYEIINPLTYVEWELCFYQRHPDDYWTCLRSFPISDI